AMQGTQKVTTTTDQQGVYRFADLADGVWSISVEMRGFATATHDVTVASSAMPEHWELTLLSFDQIAKTIPPSRIESNPRGANPAGSRGEPERLAPQAAGGGFKRAAVKPTSRAATEPPAGAPPPPPPAESSEATDGFLINGSVNNGAASPFAQPAAFGNNRRGPGSLYTGMIGVLGDTSKWDARPYSFTGQAAPQPDYNDVHAIGFFRGPFLLPGVHQNRLNVTVGFQHTANHNATTRSTVVPTALERAGDFSQTTDAFGRAIRVTDPLTGRPFAGNTIPADRLSPAALSLLRLYPQPNVSDGGRFNYQAPTLQASRQDGVQSQLVQPINSRNTLSGALAYQRVDTNNTSLFGFEDAGRVSTFDTSVLWTHRISPFVWLRPKYEFTGVSNTTTPYFAGRENVSGDAGIIGSDQTPENWGPPALVFASGVETLSDAVPTSTRSRTNAMGGDLFLSHGRHGITIGADARLQRIDIDSQQDPRGRFSFNGAYSGWDFADFLLGLPRTTSIAYGNADKRFSSGSYDAYVTDDWRVSPSVTVTAGARWEYETPMTEALGRLVNLDIAPGFSAIVPVLASNPTGALTGTTYTASLLHPDRGGLQPRTAVAWRPVPGSSLVVRAGYGIYRNTNVYQSITTLLAQQPPLSHTFSLENSSTDPLTLASALAAAAPTGGNTFAVDPNLRVGSAQNWQASVQRDFPFSLTITGTYLGTKGSHLMQEILPNTNPPGADNPCPSCPVGFVYLTSNGSSLRNAGQIQIRRRLRNGLTWTTQYTLSKATDNATAFSGVGLSGSAIAQDWRNLDAERAPSAFDQRHLLTASVEYTTGVGVHGGGLLTGWRGAMFKGWTMSAQMKAGSGMPYSPIYQVAVPGTGVLGTVRADLTGAPLTTDQAGYYVNPAAFAIPAAGHWGSAGRNSVRGPKQFTLDASITRTFPWSGRRNWDFRIDVTNILNRVTYSTIDTVVGTPQFGQAILANPMRKIQTSLRLRF
ncbi:MAG TPA: carboxypeptidase-like regulatory domain-containing protein, partial [Vicinamibacterales bacterium]|nr:carboxypeptidase-like regulatory domain-containing protein [Vicinamibacterales bacterium]